MKLRTSTKLRNWNSSKSSSSASSRLSIKVKRWIKIVVLITESYLTEERLRIKYHEKSFVGWYVYTWSIGNWRGSSHR